MKVNFGIAGGLAIFRIYNVDTENQSLVKFYHYLFHRSTIVLYSRLYINDFTSLYVDYKMLNMSAVRLQILTVL